MLTLMLQYANGWNKSARYHIGAMVLVCTACSAEQPDADTRGVLDLFISEPLDIRLEGLAYVISGGDAGVTSGALGPQRPVAKLMLAPGQGYSIAVTGLGIPEDADENTRVACEASKDFDIRELRTTELDLNMHCDSVGSVPTEVVEDSSCSVAAMVVAPRIQQVGGSITLSADPFPEGAPLRWTTPDNGIGRILSVGEEGKTRYGFECVEAGFTEIVAEVSDGACKAHASSAVVCMKDQQAPEQSE